MIKRTVRIASNNLFLKDAIGNFCYDLANVFRKNGYNAELYAFSHDKNNLVKNYEALFIETKPEDLIFYHHSINDSFLPEIAAIPVRKIFYFHGVTPPELLRQYQPITANDCEIGLQQLQFINQFDVLCVNSESTAKQLSDYTDQTRLIPRVLPPIIASRESLQKIVGNTKKIELEKKTIISVGRIVPHKKIEDTIKLFSAYVLSHPEVDIALHIVGTFPETAYRHEILTLITELKLTDKIIFKGFISDEALLLTYASADCYILMSEHEGFGVPLVEVMKANIPILAYCQNGVKEVLGNSGCQITNKKPENSVEKLHSLLFDKKYRDMILLNQEMQLKKILSSCDESAFLKLVLTDCE